MMDKIKNYWDILENIWMGKLYYEQGEYEKKMCLYPNDGSDWRRI